MDIVLISGSAGLAGGESVSFFSEKFDLVVGVDNNMRSVFFGQEASVDWNRKRLEKENSNYRHFNLDVRDQSALEKLFRDFNTDIKLVIHTAAQPSHDWAADDPMTDFAINANGTLHLLELTRQYCPKAVFIFTSTNKVYGENPNRLPLVEKESRWEIPNNHPYYQGIDEQMSIDHTKHSLFGASKIAADILTQEYGRYFGLKTGVFRAGCLTGPHHSGAKLHGFLSYLMKCTVGDKAYTVFGYGGKQVRDNLHASDLVNIFWHFYQKPRPGEVYNIGGGRLSNCSLIEAIRLCEEIADKKLNYTYSAEARKGDHIWWISDMSKFKAHFPDWKLQYDLKATLSQIFEALI